MRGALVLVLGLLTWGCSDDPGLTPGGCPSNRMVCGNECVDTNTDRDHCGGCDSPCGGGELCNGNGQCELSCQDGLVNCRETCIDPQSNRDFCGASDPCGGAQAGEECEQGFVCAAGECSLSCQPGSLDCEGECINPLTNNQRCGASGDCLDANAGTSCGVDQTCISGSCVTITFASCFELLQENPGATDGVYTIIPATNKQVFCDMTNGGVTYEELAIGQRATSYAGYDLITVDDLNTPVTQMAFRELFNLQGGLYNLETNFEFSHCCVQVADSTVGTAESLRFTGTGGNLAATIFPADFCTGPASLDKYGLGLALNGGVWGPGSQLPGTFFTGRTAINAACSADTGNRAAWFWARQPAE